ncbi:hypothetical protein P4V41_07330 [Fictibacillus nanhaiensis]|uniref:hypothetical protein n=1 Tax=Fictibacillus nanhaiensis TaxID=742169 RepID=UPI002E239471|nr:hypothetical protein [Fictibacillus nanhaiensis]
MTIIKVVDSIMGSGKTSAAINLMKEAPSDKNFVFITPFLPEVERIKDSIDKDIRRFHDPKIHMSEGKLNTKLDSLHKLLANNKDIVSTHALFKRATDETKSLIHAGDYTLILDEVMDVVEQLKINKNDLELLFNQELIYLEDGFIKWNENKKDFETRYDDIRDMALNNNLIYFRETILIWTFPVEVFKAFKEVYILTYLFDSQLQKYYYDLHDLKYEKYIAEQVEGKYIITNNEANTKHIKQSIKEKINIYEGNLNNIGDEDFSLSSSWYEKKSTHTKGKLKNNIGNYFKNKVKSSSEEAMWTTFKKQKDKLKGQGYTKGFVSCTARATNVYKDKKNLAYTINRFINPIISGFFNEKGIELNQNKYALSELVQWIWRSAIRDGKEINLYIPSKRMRKLLIDWLDDKL